MPKIKNKPPLKKMKKHVSDLGPKSILQYNVIKSIEREKRVNPKKVFQKYKPPKKV